MATTQSIREDLFVAGIMRGLSAVAACTEAGWSKKYATKSAHLILARPHVQQAIAAAQAKLREQAEMTAERLLKMFLATYDMAMAAKQSTGAVRAGEMIGKLTGLIKERVAVEVEQKPSLSLAIEAGRRRIGLLPRVSADIIDVTPTSEPAPVADDPFGE